MEIRSAQARPDQGGTSIGTLLGLLALGLCLSSLALGAVGDHVARLEQYSAEESSGMWIAMGALIAFCAVAVWACAVWGFAADRRFGDTRILGRAVLVLAPTPLVLALAVHLWPTLTTVGLGG